MRHARPNKKREEKRREVVSLSMALLFLVVVLVLDVVSRRPCHALLQDKGWYKKFLGKVTHAEFTYDGGRRIAVVATDQNVIASISLQSGDIFWRSTLRELDEIESIQILPEETAFVTLSGKGTYVRAWNLSDGKLFWESQLPHTSCLYSELYTTPIEIYHGKRNDIKAKLIVVHRGWMLHGISSVNGEIIWQTDTLVASEGGVYVLKKILVSPDEARLYGVGFTGTSGFSVWKISWLTGKASVQEASKLPMNISTDTLVVTNDTVIALDVRRRTIISGHIGVAKSFSLYATDIRSLVPDSPGKAELLSTTMDGVFCLKFTDQIALLKIGQSDHGLHLVEKFEQPVAITTHSVELPNDKSVLAIVQHVGYPLYCKVAVRIVFKDGDDIETFSELVEMGPNRGLIQSVHLNACVRRESSLAFQLLVVGDDDSLSLLQQGDVVWSREDGLGSIVDTLMVDLPLENNARIAKLEPNFIDWIKRYPMKLKATLLPAKSEALEYLQVTELSGIQRNTWTQNCNGLRKLLIVLTKSGKLYMLNTEDGRVMHSLLIPAFYSPGRQRTLLKIFPWNLPNSSSSIENPVVLVVGKYGRRPDARGIFSWVDVYDGKEVNATKLSYVVDQVIPLPLNDSSQRILHLVIDSNANAHLFPLTEESLEILHSQKSNTHFYMTDKDKGHITGYMVKNLSISPKVVATDGHFLESEKTWMVSFPVETEKIIGTASKNLNKVKALANKNNSLSTRIIFVTTVTALRDAINGGILLKDNLLISYIIDAITGRILHHVKHSNVQGPVHMVNSENWLAYHYFNLQSHQAEMAIVKFFNEKHQGTQNISDPLADIRINLQNYSLPHFVKTMALLDTPTTKKILLGTIHDQILVLDKHFLDSLTSLRPACKQEEAESSLKFIHRVEGLRGISTVPESTLESTSIVSAYGLDLFLTCIAPSEDITLNFTYAMLPTIIVAALISLGFRCLRSKHLLP